MSKIISSNRQSLEEGFSKSFQERSGRSSKSIPTLNQIKLAVALELRAEGYEMVVFDRVVEFNGRRVRAHVFCMDEDGFCLAVYCINRADLMKAEKVFDVASIMSRCGYDIALVFPLTLLNRAAEIIGMTSRVFMVDSEGSVWNHYPWKGSRLMEVFRKTEEDLLKGEEEDPAIVNQGARPRVFYRA